ncbi:MAG: hypothetical protein IT201_11020 [Thermoleophilia bacterium]|nr:hypothetical protein [Thermoleophilia bacterium]
MALRAFLLASLTAAALCLATVASPAAAARGGTGIELVGGSGLATLSLKGAALGTVARGVLTIRERSGSAEVEILVHGYDWERELSNGGMLYGGEGIRFRVFGGAWRLRVQGSGINVSAVGRGFAGLRGSGRYSLAGGPYLRWTATYRTIELA